MSWKEKAVEETDFAVMITRVEWRFQRTGESTKKMAFRAFVKDGPVF